MARDFEKNKQCLLFKTDSFIHIIHAIEIVWISAYILMFKYLIYLMIILFISQHLLSTHICFMLCVKLVFALMLVWAPCISVVHHENIVDQYIVVSFGYIYSALPIISRSVLAKLARRLQEANVQHHIK